ncbi:MAG TPA: NACHT domain-containing protein [Anaerolineales bacterium]|nr:NACHT domain-containing protein [Anaerolineales bacterium]
MTELNRYALLMEAYAELKTEIESAHQAKPIPTLPSLSEVLDEFGPMPEEALFLGVASDGLPVLLNLHDPHPGPLLIIGDAGTGKTSLLKIVAHAIQRMHKPQNVQFGVITNYPDEWSELEKNPNLVGIFPVYHKSAEDFILSLASWAHGNKSSKQSVLLLFDGFDSVSKLDFEAKQNLRWLLLRGPSRRVWSLLTLNAQRLNELGQWLDFFRTRIFGRIEPKETIRSLKLEQANPQTLHAGFEFTLREGSAWLRFWIPSPG